MSEIDARLSHALLVWRRELEYAKSGVHPNFSVEEVEARRCSVIVSHTGELAALQAAGLQAGHDNHGLVAGVIRLSDVERLAAVPCVVRIAKEPDFRILDVSVPEMRVPWKDPIESQDKGAGVIVAVIDTGIDIFHESFRDADGTTRILELWDQSATTGGTLPPPTYQQIGQVYSLAAINAGLTAGPPFASVDINGHGTHVAGIAAGNGSQDDRCDSPGKFVGVAPQADLVVVKAIALPAGATPNISDAILWCADASTRLQAVPPGRTPAPRPVVINCSFGSDIGPHDGNGLMDAWIDGVLRPGGGNAPPGLAMAIAAGNAGALEIHETGSINPGAAVTVPFYIPDGSTTPDTLDIWYTGGATLNIEIIAPPNPAAPGPVTTGPVTATRTVPVGLMNINFSFKGPDAAHGNRSNIQVSIQVRPPPQSPPLAVRSGNWQMRLTNTAGPTATWDAWFASKHSDTFPTFKMPNDPDITPRRRLNTISEPATSRNAITVASYNPSSGELADSSSRGPDTVPPNLPVGEFKPTVAAPGVGIKAPHSQAATNDDPSSCCDQKVVDMNGTSMASPHVAGLVTLIFEKNKNLTFDQARAHIQRAARIDGIPPDQVPPIYDVGMNIRANNLWGSGKVNAAQTLADIPAAALAMGNPGPASPFLAMEERAWGYTPHTYASRLRDWQARFGTRPGLMLFASLVSEHIDEVLYLVNHNQRIATVWRRNGGPQLIRHLLNGPAPHTTLMPPVAGGFDVAALLQRLLPMLSRFGGERLKTDIVRFRDFAALWPTADLERLDREALARSPQ